MLRYSRVVHSRVVHPCYFVPSCPLPRCQLSRFRRPPIKQLFKVLTLVANVRPQLSAPLIDGLVDDAVLQLSPDGDGAALKTILFRSGMRK